MGPSKAAPQEVFPLEMAVVLGSILVYKGICLLVFAGFGFELFISDPSTEYFD